MAKIGLVLGSGGAKGSAHIPIIEMIESLDIKIHAIAGSSVGSIIGAAYALGTLKQLKNEALNMEHIKILNIIDPIISKSGMIKGTKIMNFLKRFIPEDARFEDLKVKFAIVATDYYSGEQIIFTKGNILKAIRASISIPAIFMPVTCDSQTLIDGGIANPLPIDAVKRMGAKKVIAINLYPPVRKKDKIQDNKQSSRIEILTPKHYLKKDYGPTIIQAISQTIKMFENANTKKIILKQKPDILIEPDVLDISFLDFFQLKKAYDIGVKEAERHKKEIQRLKRWI
jgi:NTE family protein